MSESSPPSQPNPLPPQLPRPNLVVSDGGADQDCDVLIVAVRDSETQPQTTVAVDQRLSGAILRLIEADKVSCDSGDTLLIPGPRATGGDTGALLVLLVGIGDAETLSRGDAFRVVATAMRSLVGESHQNILVSLPEVVGAADHDAVVAAAIYALEGQGIYKTKPVIHVPDSIAFSDLNQDALTRGQILGDSVNHTKRLVNEPAAMIYPESFADRVSELASEVGLRCQVWDEDRLEEENCRAILAVGAGSDKPPRLVILEHRGGADDEPPIAIVGKGVTFDCGGLSIKPSDGMVDMKCDMAGAATVVGVMHALAKLGVKRNVIGLCGLAENMVSGSSYKLGDVIETRSGKTIEILNTDAEGRVVLADTLNVAIGFQPTALIDLATLTGACLVALGYEVAGLFTNDQSLCDRVSLAAGSEDEPVWQLPMFKLYDEKVKSKVADIKNIGEGRWGGAITAAKFLENFVGQTPWVHMDIAGPAFADSAKPYRDAGATGALVRTLIRWIENESTSG